MNDTTFFKNTLLSAFIIMASIPVCYSTYVVAFSGLKGSGKTTLATAVASRLNATHLCWSSFRETSKEPKNIPDWYKRGADFNEFENNDFKKILLELKQGNTVKHSVTGEILRPTGIIIVEAPLGNGHLETRYLLDKVIYLDIDPKDAFIRQIKRDKGKEAVDKELKYFSSTLEPLFTKYMRQKIKSIGDFSVDASLSTEQQVKLVLQYLFGKQISKL